MFISNVKKKTVQLFVDGRGVESSQGQGLPASSPGRGCHSPYIASPGGRPEMWPCYMVVVALCDASHTLSA